MWLLVAALFVFECGLACLMLVQLNFISIGLQVVALLMFLIWLTIWTPNMKRFAHIPSERQHHMVKAIKSSSFVFALGVGMFSYGIYSFVPSSLFYQFRGITIIQGLFGLAIGVWQLKNMDK